MWRNDGGTKWIAKENLEVMARDMFGSKDLISSREKFLNAILL
jgi:hypothetical protein